MPEQFYGMEHTFDNFNVSEKIFVSEYAARGRDAGSGTLDAALSEAVFMNGMERNSHIVKLTSCAPLSANTNGFEWLPDAGYSNSSQALGPPSYSTQHLHAHSFRGVSGAPMMINSTCHLVEPVQQLQLYPMRCAATRRQTAGRPAILADRLLPCMPRQRVDCLPPSRLQSSSMHTCSSTPSYACTSCCRSCTPNSRRDGRAPRSRS